MGIKGLAKLLSDEAPECVREVPLSSLQGRKIAIDASMAIYQFLIAVRSGGPDAAASVLTNADGETTSHIQGMFNRTIRFMTEGIRPAFVFDGRPPQIKSGELTKRRERREKAQEALKNAKEEGDAEEVDRQSKRLVRAGQKENEDCKRLLRLMGVPVVDAPCEAEAQAASLAREGAVYATGTEDMDALTFRTPILLRKMTFANASKSEVQVMDYAKAVEGLGLSHDQFVDLCILLGCDYCDTIRGVGPKTALKLIREYGRMEEIVKALMKEVDKHGKPKYGIPDAYVPDEARRRRKEEERKRREAEADTDEDEDEEKKVKEEEDDVDDEEEETTAVPIYVEARKLFNEHEVLTSSDVTLKWEPCQPEALRTFLVDEMGFNADRVSSNIERLQKAHKAMARPQARMDAFFRPKEAPNAKALAAKRKAKKEEEARAKKKNKKGGGAGFFGKKRR